HTFPTRRSSDLHFFVHISLHMTELNGLFITSSPPKEQEINDSLYLCVVHAPFEIRFSLFNERCYSFWKTIRIHKWSRTFPKNRSTIGALARQAVYSY